MSLFRRKILFLLFFLSGFSSLVYQVVWTRMAFASFGIIAPVLSVVISVFMLGLCVGAWLGGKLIDSLKVRTRTSAVVFYVCTELVIGIGAFAVPFLFGVSEQILMAAGQIDSLGYLVLSALLLGASILPWCTCMGATFPFMMAYVREEDQQNTDSFSFLYVANVLGAMTGTLVTAFVLIELFGFRQTLGIAAAANFTIAIIGGCLARQSRPVDARRAFAKAIAEVGLTERPPNGQLVKWILFSTGFCSMGMELVWTRAFTPTLKTQVYSFALIVFVYLAATLCGSVFYRRDVRTNSSLSVATLMSVAAVATFLPVLFNDHGLLRLLSARLSLCGPGFLLTSIAPLCAVLGYLTPKLIDENGQGRPSVAANAYALNVLGCIIGPLFASYVLLPWVGEHYAVIALSVPFVAFYFLTFKDLRISARAVTALIVGAVLITSLARRRDFVAYIARIGCPVEARQDYAASVVSAGAGLDKHLYVNGVGVTALTPETKFMAHLPLALHAGKAKSVLIICFGMGTSFRSALSWDVETTAVELVPSVKGSFSFFHRDAAQVVANPKGHIVVDDGRRYLKRTRDKFDVIITDPPPPIETAGSSLLYSEEFYELVKQHLNHNGLIQVWFPGGETETGQAILRSLKDSFPYVQCFRGIGGDGVHMLASMQPIQQRTSEQVASAMPAVAVNDLLEWSSSHDLAKYWNEVVGTRVSTQGLLNQNAEMRITDDQPYNEYFFLRRLRSF